MNSSDPYPPVLDPYLHSTNVTSKIGSHHEWQLLNDHVYSNFAATGDWMRSASLDLELVINAGVRTVLYDGDADYICNFMGVEAMVRESCLSPPLLSCLCADIVTACADCLPKRVDLSAVREAGICELYCQWPDRWSV